MLYAYRTNLSPKEQLWDKAKFEKYSADDLFRDLFVDGPDDVAILNSTYLRDFYKNGFNTIERNAEVAKRYPERFILNGAFDPRDGEKALEYIHYMKETYNIKGVKLYTAGSVPIRYCSAPIMRSGRPAGSSRSSGRLSFPRTSARSAASISAMRSRKRSSASTPPGSTTSTSPRKRPRSPRPRSRSRRSKLMDPFNLRSARTAEVWRVVGRVHDPELDEPVTDLGFVERAEVDDDGSVELDFRLPTFWCSPNFAFLMLDGVRETLESLSWRPRFHITLHDHLFADEVNKGVAEGKPFSEIFDTLSRLDGEIRGAALVFPSSPSATRGAGGNCRRAKAHRGTRSPAPW